MSSRAKLFIWAMALAGLGVLSYEMAHWESRDLFRFCCYFAVAILASSLKVSLPAITGTMSVTFLFTLFGVLEMTLPETLLLGCAGTLIQCLWRTTRRARPVQIVFNLASMAVAIAVTYHSYYSSFLQMQTVGIALRLVSSATVFFGMNTVPVAAVIALTEGKSLRRTWRQCYFWSFPYYLVGSGVAGMASAATHYLGWQTGLLVVPTVYLIYRSYNLYLGRVEDGRKHAEEMASLHLRTIEALALAIEAKDHTTHEHLQRVQVYAIELGKELGLNEAELEALRAAAVLHDIGKLAVPEHIISKPGKLTREEFDKMKIHPVVGAEILERVQFPYPVTPIVRSHHEKWDGSGYPDGLKGEEIPIGARILACVDCLDALASDRQYRRALPLEEAMNEVQRQAGASFDPRVVEVLQRRFVELERMAQSQQVDKTKLSTDVKIERGLEPAAGFESSRKSVMEKPIDFLASIAAARQEVQNLFELAQILGNSLSLNETLSLLAIRLKPMVPYDALAIYVRKQDILRAEYVTGENFRLFSSLEIPIGQGLSGWVAENRKPIINGNPAVEPGYLNDSTKFTTMRSALAVPLVGLNGSASVLTLYHSERDAFTPDHLRILLAITPKVALSIENALKYQEAQNSASTDFMTGLPNARALFLHLDAELARCRRAGAPLMVLVCDLNGFKHINDKYGHLEGNRQLRAVAQKLKQSCRDYDYVARMGGDEFVMIMPGLRAAEVQNRLQRFSTVALEPGQSVLNESTLTLSIGHALYPEDGHDAEQLLREADRRMYTAKQKEKLTAMDRRGYEFDSAAMGTT